MKLSLHATMWSNNGRELKRDNPIQYEVRGLPSDFERIFIGKNFRRSPDPLASASAARGHEWGDNYESPESALDALQAEFGAAVR